MEYRQYPRRVAWLAERWLWRADSCLMPDAAQPVICTGSGHALGHDDERAQAGKRAALA